MKRDKWLKWKLGAIFSLGITITFHEIKASSAFAEASANAGSTDDHMTAGTNGQDPVMDDNTWQSFFNDGNSQQDNMSNGSTNDMAPNDDMGSGSGFASRDPMGAGSDSGGNSFFGSGSSGQNSVPQASNHTRTGRS